MAYICLNANECRAFIKNGKLRFQARQTNKEGDIVDQVTISLPKDMTYFFTQIIDLEGNTSVWKNKTKAKSRIIDFLNENE